MHAPIPRAKLIATITNKQKFLKKLFKTKKNFKTNSDEPFAVNI